MTVVIKYIIPATTLQRTFNNTTPAVINYYNVMFTVGNIPVFILGIILYISSGGIPAYILPIYPMRVTVHRCVYMRQKEVNICLAESPPFTIDVVYTNIQYAKAH